MVLRGRPQWRNVNWVFMGKSKNSDRKPKTRKVGQLLKNVKNPPVV